MRLMRVLLGTAGALALTAGGAAALADDPTQIRLVEVYEMTPGVNAIHQVTLSTSQPLIGEQCQSMGTATKATSSLLVSVDGVDGCRFTWELEDGGAEVVSVDDGGVFHFESTSARLLEGFSSPDASASIESVTLIAHSSLVIEASDGGQIITPGASTKTDASTVTWHHVTSNVSATGTVDANASSVSPSPTLSPSPSANSASTQERGHTSTARSLTPIVAITGGVLLIVAITGLVRRSRQSRRAPPTRSSRATRLCVRHSGAPHRQRKQLPLPTVSVPFHQPRRSVTRPRQRALRDPPTPTLRWTRSDSPHPISPSRYTSRWAPTSGERLGPIVCGVTRRGSSAPRALRPTPSNLPGRRAGACLPVP